MPVMALDRLGSRWVFYERLPVTGMPRGDPCIVDFRERVMRKLMRRRAGAAEREGEGGGGGNRRSAVQAGKGGSPLLHVDQQ